MRSRRWSIVLYAWDASCHSSLKEFAVKNGYYYALDPYYHLVTYPEEGREAEPPE